MTANDALRAAPVHAGAMAAIHASAFPPAEQWGPDAFALQLALPNVIGLIREGGLILARAAADEAEILTLAVHPAYRRKGLARALLADATALLRTAGATRLFLEVSEANLAARALYAASGFHQVGRRPRYYPDGSDALVLQRDLDLPPLN